MADVILYGQKGGKSTKDATATAEDIRAGLTAYIASGKVTGTLAAKFASGVTTLPANGNEVSVTLNFIPVAVFAQRSAITGDTTFQNATLLYDGTQKKVAVTAGGYSALESLSITENGISLKGYSSSATQDWRWFAAGL